MAEWFKEDKGLSIWKKRCVFLFLMLYLLFLIRLCFGPQLVGGGGETPGIQHFGRVVVLLIPFNSIVNAGQLKTFWDYVWVFGQNVSNIFLLFPVMFLFLILYPGLRSFKRITLLAFCFSIGIELTQVIIDILWDANRVFEIDDLWTNALGGTIALIVYRCIHKLKK